MSKVQSTPQFVRFDLWLMIQLRVAFISIRQHNTLLNMNQANIVMNE